MKTYWLWHGQRIVGSVRLPEGASDTAVVMAALKRHERIPLSEDGFTPFEWAQMIRRAEVRTYEGGN